MPSVGPRNAQKTRAMNKGHGGAREGAGRPAVKTSDKRESITIRLPPDLTSWLGSFGRQKGRIVEQALRQYRASELKQDDPISLGSR